MLKIYTILNANDQIITLTCALLHNVSRFEQLKKYSIFSDFKSEDHASLDARTLNALGYLMAYIQMKNTSLIKGVHYLINFSLHYILRTNGPA